MVYTAEFAEQLVRAQGYAEPAPEDISFLMERLWGVYVPTCPEHADALLEKELPVNLTAANLSYPVPPYFRKRLSMEAEQQEANDPLRGLVTAEGGYVFVPPELLKRVLLHDQAQEEKAMLDPVMLSVFEEARRERADQQRHGASSLPAEHPFQPFWLKDSPEEAVLKNQVIMDDFLRKRGTK